MFQSKYVVSVWFNNITEAVCWSFSIDYNYRCSYMVCFHLCLAALYSPFRGVVQLIVIVQWQSEFADSDPLFLVHRHRVVHVGFSDRGEPAKQEMAFYSLNQRKCLIGQKIKITLCHELHGSDQKKELTLGVELCKGIPSHLQPRVMWGQRAWDWGKDGRSWSRWGDTPTRNPIVLPQRTGEFHQLHGSWPQGYGVRWLLPVDTTLDIL